MYYSLYFDQQDPLIPIKGMIADMDLSEDYELQALAVFKAERGGYLVVFIAGCSCWPDRGSTEQRICNTKTEVQKAIREFCDYYDFAPLMDKLQDVSWRVDKGRQ